MSSSPHWKIKWARTKQKCWKRNQKENRESKKNEWKREMNEKTMKNDLAWNDPRLRSPWNTVWAYLSFLSKPRTHAYITYLKSPFWLNVDTWTEEFSSLRIFFHNQQGGCLFSSANKKILINLSLIQDEFWIVKCIIG